MVSRRGIAYKIMAANKPLNNPTRRIPNNRCQTLLRASQSLRHTWERKQDSNSTRNLRSWTAHCKRFNNRAQTSWPAAPLGLGNRGSPNPNGQRCKACPVVEFARIRTDLGGPRNLATSKRCGKRSHAAPPVSRSLTTCDNRKIKDHELTYFSPRIPTMTDRALNPARAAVLNRRHFIASGTAAMVAAGAIATTTGHRRGVCVFPGRHSTGRKTNSLVVQTLHDPGAAGR